MIFKCLNFNYSESKFIKMKFIEMKFFLIHSCVSAREFVNYGTCHMYNIDLMAWINIQHFTLIIWFDLFLIHQFINCQFCNPTCSVHIHFCEMVSIIQQCFYQVQICWYVQLLLQFFIGSLIPIQWLIGTSWHEIMVTRDQHCSHDWLPYMNLAFKLILIETAHWC